jgi:hypothetical protein
MFPYLVAYLAIAVFEINCIFSTAIHACEKYLFIFSKFYEDHQPIKGSSQRKAVFLHGVIGALNKYRLF